MIGLAKGYAKAEGRRDGRGPQGPGVLKNVVVATWYVRAVQGRFRPRVAHPKPQSILPVEKSEDQVSKMQKYCVEEPKGRRRRDVHRKGPKRRLTYPLSGAERGEGAQVLAAIRMLIVAKQSAALVLHIVGPTFARQNGQFLPFLHAQLTPFRENKMRSSFNYRQSAEHTSSSSFGW